ncbi:DEAD/DEAH box helicase family protein [Mycoplasma sp. 1199]|uniref:DEAD/DEAH box helicase n=1 Tax=Mycoplasma sp. 1199 TaxID=3108526 RepID=UPI002B1DF303|nr:DEAD/DEAH box helicase family protein [Mycoplasma sp. 1199]MEA4206204.1 DEAD/DEAH box helicase family protein [Mycoplasma sp. 1199]
MKLTSTQQNAVNQVVTIYQEQNSKNALLWAPTGSGKTFMVANIIDNIVKIQENKNEKVIFIFATISTAELPRQLENKFREYKYFLTNDFPVEYYESPSNSQKDTKDSEIFINFVNNKVYIVGTQTFGKNRIMSERGIFKDFLQEARDKYGAKIVFIRDEAHIGMASKTNNEFERSLNEIVANYVDFTLTMTATPKYEQYNSDIQIVRVRSEEIENDINVSLLKTNLITPTFNEDVDNVGILEEACKIFVNEIQPKYNDPTNKNHLAKVRPAMLVQVDNKPKDAEKAKLWDEAYENIIKVTKKYGLKVATYFADKKDGERSDLIGEEITLNNLSKSNSLYDVIIFKIGPTVGWDIPRACMLVQLRNISSESLEIQTIGRIKRNPVPEIGKINGDWIGKYYWIVSFKDVKTLDNYCSYVLKNQYKEERFYSGELRIITNEKKEKEFLKNKYDDEINEFLDNFKWDKYLKQFYDYVDNCEKLIQDSDKNSKDVLNIKSYINNQIDLRKYIFNIKNKKFKNLLNENLIHKLQAIKEKLNFKYSDDMFYYFVFNPYWFNVSDKFYIQNIQLSLMQIYKNNLKPLSKNAYVLKEGITLPEQYRILKVLNDTKNEIETKTIRAIVSDRPELKNAYQILDRNENKDYKDLEDGDEIIYLDSKPEQNVVKELIKLIDVRENLNVKIWTKLPVAGKVGFEYAKYDDGVTEIHQSKPDFILKIDNHQIFIEIKHLTNDPREDKTKAIQEAYSNYPFTIGENHRLYKDDLTMIVLRVGDSKKMFEGQENFASKIKCQISGASSIKKINDYIEKNKTNDDLRLKNVLDFLISDKFAD